MRSPMMCWLLCFILAGCADKQPPTWQPGATLVAMDVTTTSASVQWPVASDDRAVVDYVLRWGDGEHSQQDTAPFSITDLNEAHTYSLSLLARDAAGNQSLPLRLDRIFLLPGALFVEEDLFSEPLEPFVVLHMVPVPIRRVLYPQPQLLLLVLLQIPPL